MSGFPRHTSTPSRSCPSASRSPTRYSTAALAEPFPWGRNLTCIAAVLADMGDTKQRALQRHKVGDHRDGLRCRGVGVRPARKLVEVVPDASDLPSALALDGACRRGPRPRLRHRPPQQLGRRNARRRCLRPPSGVLCGRDARRDHHGAALRHGRTGDGVRGAASRARPLTSQRRAKLGVLGGRSVPLARPQCSTLRRLAYGP